MGRLAMGQGDGDADSPASAAGVLTAFGATVYRALGVDHEADVADPFGRPVRLNRGTPIEALYGA